MNSIMTATCKTDIKFDVLTKDLVKKIDMIITKNGNNPSRLVNIFLEIQGIIPKQYIPTEVATYVSEQLELQLTQVYDVISFYAALSATPQADYVIQICDSVVCHVVGANALRESLEKIVGIKIGEISYDGKFLLKHTPCFGACDISPAIRLNGKVYGHLNSEDKIREIISECNSHST